MVINFKEERCFKILVTPEMAEEFLARNVCNRNISDKEVTDLVKKIQNGEWCSNNDDICFSKTGELINGQHRLTSIVRAGIPVYLWIKTGLEKSPNFDNVRKRSIRDQILVSGLAKKDDVFADNKCIAVARFLYSYSCSSSGVNINTGDYRVSTTETFKWMVQNEEALSVIHKLGNSHSGIINCRSAFILSAVFLCYVNGISEENIRDWYRVVRLGEYDSDKQLSAIAFRNFLIGMQRKNQGEMLVGFLKAQHSIREFNVRKVKTLSTNYGFPFEWRVNP